MDLIKEFLKILNNLSGDGWIEISRQKTLSVEFIREYKDRISWGALSRNYILTKEFIDEFNVYLYLPGIWEYNKLDEDILTYLIQKNQDIKWYLICRYQKLSESFIRKFHNELNWNNVCEYQILSESFMREFQNKINWYYVSRYQVLSENFIEEFQNDVDWSDICKYQILSKSFIEKMKDKIKWDCLSQSINLTYEIVEFFKSYIDFEEVLLISGLPREDKLKCCLFMKISQLKDYDYYGLKDKIKILKKVYKEKRFLTQEEVDAVFIMEKLLSN